MISYDIEGALFGDVANFEIMVANERNCFFDKVANLEERIQRKYISVKHNAELGMYVGKAELVALAEMVVDGVITSEQFVFFTYMDVSKYKDYAHPCLEQILRKWIWKKHERLLAIVKVLKDCSRHGSLRTKASVEAMSELLGISVPVSNVAAKKKLYLPSKKKEKTSKK